MKEKFSLALLIFAAFWCGILLFLDSLAVPSLVKQVRASSFPTTTGQITKSESRTTVRAKSKRRYRWTIEYGYTVAGRELKSDRIHFGTTIFGNGKKQAQRYTADYPVGKEVAVFYDSSAPDQAVLRPGLLPDHLLMALGLVPFHVIGFGLLAVALGPLIRRWRGDAGSLVLRPIDDLRMAVRMPWLSPWAVGMIALSVVALPAMLIGILLLPLPPSMPAMVAIWGSVLAVAALMAWRRRSRLDAGFANLVIDAGSRHVTLPLGFGRKERVTIPFDEVHGLTLKTRIVRTRSLGRTRHHEHFDLFLIGPNHQSFQLATAGTPEKLSAIGETLRDTFGWPLQQ